MPNKNARPVEIDNHLYPTISAAEQGTGIRHQVIRRYLKAGRGDELNDWNGGRPWIVIGKKRYRTWEEASKATGYSRQWLMHCKRAGALETLKPKQGQ